MSKKAYTNTNSLIGLAPLMLFLSSYLPLYLIVAVRQLLINFDYLHWVGLNTDGFFCFVQHFGMATLCVILSIISLFGTNMVLQNLHNNVENGNIVRITEVSSMNDEPLAYVATYIIPLMFDGYSSISDWVTVLCIFYVMYRLYVKYKLILVNPFLSIKYSIYSISYDDGGIIRQGILISKDREIQENEKAKIYNVGYQLFFGYKR